jgi:NifB/MoaA-like Fe-S oxidoreductase
MDLLRTLDSRRDRLGDAVLIPSVALKEDEDIFLDDVSLRDLASHLGPPALRVEATARGFVSACLGT